MGQPRVTFEQSHGVDPKQYGETMKFNINENVMVKLTDVGREIHKKAHDDFCENFPSVSDDIKEYHPKKEDIQGWSEWQLWSLMEMFGSHIGLGVEPPFNTTIIIKKTHK